MLAWAQNQSGLFDCRRGACACCLQCLAMPVSTGSDSSGSDGFQPQARRLSSHELLVEGGASGVQQETLAGGASAEVRD